MDNFPLLCAKILGENSAEGNPINCRELVRTLPRRKCWTCIVFGASLPLWGEFLDLRTPLWRLCAGIAPGTLINDSSSSRLGQQKNVLCVNQASRNGDRLIVQSLDQT